MLYCCLFRQSKFIYHCLQHNQAFPHIMQLSVIIVNYNVCYFLEQCLHSVLKASSKVSTEIIVVDNNSVDDSVAMVKEKFAQVTLIENKKNTGFSFANNQAIKIAKGEFVLLLNPDTVVEEDTFEKTVSFMETHEDCGGLGVLMIDGKGKFLPESKRGLPTPSVAFYKIFGLSALFPKSKLFGKYHLGYLDKHHIHEVDVLSGAFMMLRKEALDKIGLLDENFFMYGEDIDLSYRLIKGGYKNYYFSDTRIIHYKGESTKKSSINYVFVFYRAMVIFAKKHFSQQHAKTFSFLINTAIYFRASIAVFTRFVKRATLPIIDFTFSFILLYAVSIFWELYIKKVGIDFYPEKYFHLVLPAYAFIWMTCGIFTGSYDKPLKIFNSLKASIAGAISILVIYALLPETERYSRAVILLSTPIIALTHIAIRWFLNKSGIKDFELANQKKNRFAIVGKEKEVCRVAEVLANTSVKAESIYYVSIDDTYDKKIFVGNTQQLREIVEIHQLDEVIFCAEDVSSNQIIDFMASLVNIKVDFKIAPPNSLYIIGSNSLDTAGDLYVIDLKTITKPENLRNKRTVDVIISTYLLLTLPIQLLIIKNPLQLIKNIFTVLVGNTSWVGYVKTTASIQLPKIKSGILNPSDAINNASMDEKTMNMLNEHYAKNYDILYDIKIIFKSYRNLGKPL